jgi:hypothetical protein
MNTSTYLNVVGGTATVPQPSEITREFNALDQAIQSTFDSSQELLKRLQPVLRHYPEAPQDEKCPEEALSDHASTLRRNRKAVEGINGTLRQILERLAL